MNFFFDRCLGVRIARMLSGYDSENTIWHQDDDARFNPESTDVEIISTLATESPLPVLLSADLYRKDKHARQALRQSGLSVVFFRARFNEQTFHVQAIKALTIWPQIVSECRRCREATAFEITPQARKVDRIAPTRHLK